MRALALALVALSSMALAQQNDWPITRAEASNYANTSTYADVIGFLTALQQRGAPIRISFMGESTLGKSMPLVVCHQNPDITPMHAKRLGLPVVYLQANIHAGEVEGKEATLMLMRELAQNPKSKILERVVIVATPIYNIDGNDKFGPNKVNRGHQDGPDPVGERPNGQGLDLNRDCMKAASPEFRAILQHVYNAWDPDVVIDLHTTNGTRHGYELTYSPGLNPTTDPKVFQYTVDLLAKIRRTPELNGGFNLFDYGDAFQREGKWSYSTFAAEPRYATNYASIRNRVSILSEAASFQPFKTRTLATLQFMRAIFGEVVRDAFKITRLVRDADRKVIEWGRDPSRAPAQGLRYDAISRGRERVMLEIERPRAEIDPMKAPTQFRMIEMEIFDRFKSTLSTKWPWGYVLPASATSTVELLRLHGVSVERLVMGATANLDSMAVSKANVAANAFQGHRLVTLDGIWTTAPGSLSAGEYLVRTSQPLGLVAFHMLEPESTDGAIAWGRFGTEWKVGDVAPIRKLGGKVDVVAVSVP